MPATPLFPFISLSQTKFFPPQARHNFLHRVELLESFADAIVHHPVTLVTAQAGYGKTTLLASLPDVLPNYPLAWVSLDGTDDEPTQLITLMSAALWHLNPKFGAATQALVESGVNPINAVPLERQQQRLLGVFINEILTAFPEPFLLVLDDLHCLERPATYLMLDYLLARMPAQMHLVIGSRLIPPLSLARLRARQQLAEFSVPALRFSASEIKHLLTPYLPALAQTTAFQDMIDRLEGWPAGVQLLLNSLGKMPASALPDFVGRSLLASQDIFSFLAEEVLLQQPPALQTFLLETAILSELTPINCQALTGQTEAGSLLQSIWERGLFLNLLKVDHLAKGVGIVSTYRYHALFADFLRQRLFRHDPHRYRQLHLLAAGICVDIQQKFTHLLAAESWAEVIAQIKEHFSDHIELSDLKQLNRIILALPADLVKQEPLLQYLIGNSWYPSLLGKPEAARYLHTALDAFMLAEDKKMEGKCRVSIATLALFGQGDFMKSGQEITRALALPLSEIDRYSLLFTQGWLYAAFQSWLKMEKVFDEAIGIIEATDSQVTIRQFFTYFATVGLPPLMPNGFKRFYELSLRATQLFAGILGLHQISMGNGLLLGHFWRGEWEQALEIGEKTLGVCRHFGGTTNFALETAIILARTYEVMGHTAQVDTILALAESWLPQLEPGDYPTYWVSLGRLRWEQGAEGAVARPLQILQEGHFGYVEYEKPRNMRFLRFLQLMTDKKFEQAEKELPALFGNRNFDIMFGHRLVWQAILYHRWQRPAQVLTIMPPFLQELEATNSPGWLWQHGRAVVPLLQQVYQQGEGSAAAYAKVLLENTNNKLPISSLPAPMPMQNLIEPLTKRQIEILHLLVAGKSNKAIANTLFISVGTVKTHIHQIYQKLGVKSRSQAIARTHQLSLLS